MTIFDPTLFRLNLAAARQSLELAFPTFEESKHPRLHGKFVHVGDVLSSKASTSAHFRVEKITPTHTHVRMLGTVPGQTKHNREDKPIGNLHPVEHGNFEKTFSKHLHQAKPDDVFGGDGRNEKTEAKPGPTKSPEQKAKDETDASRAKLTRKDGPKLDEHQKSMIAEIDEHEKHNPGQDDTDTLREHIHNKALTGDDRELLTEIREEKMHREKGKPTAKDEDPQQTWEKAVRDKLTAMGHDPDDVEAHNEGFGQDYAEYADDPDAYVKDALEGYDKPPSALAKNEGAKPAKFAFTKKEGSTAFQPKSHVSATHEVHRDGEHVGTIEHVQHMIPNMSGSHVSGARKDFKEFRLKDAKGKKIDHPQLLSISEAKDHAKKAFAKKANLSQSVVINLSGTSFDPVTFQMRLAAARAERGL